MKRFKIGALVMAAVILFTGLGFYLIQSKSDRPVAGLVDFFENFSVTPVSADMAGMELDSPIKIVSKEPMTTSELQNLLHIWPEEPYSIKRKSDREFLVQFGRQLKPNTVYRVSLKDGENRGRSWAFQTKREFRVVGTLPRDKGQHVPVDSGIEIRFSYAGVESLEKYFEITPKVEGRFEYYKNTAIYVHKGLEKNTLYTVKVKAGLGLKDSGEKLKEDYVFKFKTAGDSDDENGYLKFSDELFDLTTKSPQLLETAADSKYRGKKFHVEVYRYKNKKDFIDDVIKIDDSKMDWYDTPAKKVEVDSGKLEKVMEFKTELKTADQEMWYRAFLVFPEKLEVGDYLVNMSLDDINLQTHVQVNDLAVYAMVGEKENLVWVNDIHTKGPVKGAVVRDLQTSESAVTGSDGTAIIGQKSRLDENFPRAYFVVEVPGKSSFLVRVKPQYDMYEDYYYYSGGQSAFDRNYWSYMFLDRGIYLPTDRINVWGLAKPSGGSQKLAGGVLQLNKVGYDGNFMEVDSREVTLSNFNTYEASFEVTNLMPGSYCVDFKNGDRLISRAYFDVREYVKPAYRLDTELDRETIFGWESARLSVNASFYEGTPVSGLKLKYNRYEYYRPGKESEGYLKCDSNGHAEIIYNPDIHTDEWRPVTVNFNIHNAEAEDEEIYASKSLTVFPRDVMIKVSTRASKDKTRGYATFYTNRIDISKAGSESYYMDETFKGDPIEIPLEVKIYEVSYDSQENGEYYDFINKKVIKKYIYKERKELLNTVNGRTKGGVFSIDFAIKPDKNYVIEARGKDTRGSSVREETWFMMHDYYEIYRQDRYELTTGDNEDKKYRPNEIVAVKLSYNRQDVPVTQNGRVLYMVLKDGLKDYKVSYRTEEKFTFCEDYVPNTFICGVYFDGEKIYRAGARNLLYDYKEKQLDIQIKPDKENYAPGDTVNLDITVKKPDGTPAGAQVNLSVVDESFFALAEQYVNTAESIYDYRFGTGILLDYVSYKKIDILDFGGAEGGGEGGDEAVRGDFKDTAFFKSVTTDSRGKGRISFRLPDNLTSWRITYQAVTADLYAGSGKMNINAKLPFFLTLIMSDKYMAGDSPCITARSFGTAVSGKDMVDYTVRLEDAGGKVKEIKKSERAGNYACINLGTLSEGSYSITVEARSGEHFDGIERTFTVAESTLDVIKTEHLQLRENLKIPGSNGFVVLKFYNRASSVYYRALTDLKYSWGERVDQILSKVISDKLLERHFGEKSRGEDFNLTGYQTENGGISLLPYSDADPHISSRVAALAKDLFDKNALKTYFYGILDDRKSAKDDVVAAYLGLAALQEPVLVDIQRFIKDEALDAKERLILGIALAQLGDEAQALDIYAGIMKSYAKKSGDTYYITAGDRNDILELTSLAAVLATKLGMGERYGLLSYAAGNKGDKVLTNLEQMTCIVDDIPDAGEVASFTYILNGRQQKVELKGHESFEMLLKPGEAGKIAFKDIHGDVMVAASFAGKVKDIGELADNLSLTRSYLSSGRLTDKFEQSQLVQVVLTPKFSEAAPEGFYEITDVLPAGMRYVKYGQAGVKTCYPMEQSGQKVVFGYYYSKKEPRESIVYFARVAVPGTYTADHAVMKHTESGAAALAGKTTVHITE
jgi:hypothetical protein